MTDHPQNEALRQPSNAQLKEWRRLVENTTMVSGLGAYRPEEFLVLLDEVDRLRAILAARQPAPEPPRATPEGALADNGAEHTAEDMTDRMMSSLMCKLIKRAGDLVIERIDNYPMQYAQRERTPADLDRQDVETLAAKFHEIYQQEAKRQGDVRHKDNYADLPENIKEFDRVLARYVLSSGLDRQNQALRETRFDEAKWWIERFTRDDFFIVHPWNSHPQDCRCETHNRLAELEAALQVAGAQGGKP